MMGKTAKIIVTVILTVVFIFLSAAAGGMPPNDYKGIICTVVFMAWIGSYVAVWKKRKE
ncbi:MAG: hypothetical protein MJY44_05780 [Bacteroidales bacterium]|nr:hypothetical protein [Bacteroidales bacterium]